MTSRSTAAAMCLVLGSASLSVAAFAAPEATLDLAIEPREVRVGDVVEATLTLVVSEPLAGAPEFPNWQRHWGTAEIRGVEEIVVAPAPAGSAGSAGADGSAGSAGSAGSDSSGASTRYVQTLHLTSFRPGTVNLPPATVILPSPPGADEAEPVRVSTVESAAFEVVSVLPPAGEEQLEPKPPEEPRTLPVGEAFWWTAGILAALAAALAALLLARRPAEETYAGKKVDPWAALEQALARLAHATDPETVFTGLSLELRRYLGRTLQFPAAESTTTELRRRLLGTGLPSTVCGDVVRLLREADTVKFARQSPPRDRPAQCLDEVRRAAVEVRTFLEPAPAAGDEEQAA